VISKYYWQVSYIARFFFTKKIAAFFTCPLINTNIIKNILFTVDISL
jgi:hypothetical protein